MLNLIQSIRDLNREIQHLVDQLFQVADYIESGNDSLTQLLNRRYLNTIISREINFSRDNQTPLSLLAIDADFFKAINDKYGHAAGDLALKFIADALQKYIQGSDYAFRVGGEEFLLLLVDSDERRALNIAENIRTYVEHGLISTAQGQQFRLTVSIGCALFDGHPDYQRFLDAADAALYMAKNTGRNRVYLAQPSQIQGTQKHLSNLKFAAELQPEIAVLPHIFGMDFGFIPFLFKYFRCSSFNRIFRTARQFLTPMRTT